MPGAIQAGLRQLFGSAAAGPDNASVSPVASTSSRTLTIGADCQDKAISSSKAYFFVPKEEEKSRFSRLRWPLA